MKVVFLDIDGVLQPFGRQERFKHIDEVPALCKMLNDERGIDFEFTAWCDRNSMACYDIASVYYDWDEASINFLHELLDETDALIVLSTDWREKGDDVMKGLLAIHDFARYWYGTTYYIPRDYSGNNPHLIGRMLPQQNEGLRDAYQSAMDSLHKKMNIHYDNEKNHDEWNHSYVDSRTVEIREYLDRHREITDYVVLDDLNLTSGNDGHDVITRNRFKMEDYEKALEIMAMHDGPFPLEPDMLTPELELFRKEYIYGKKDS